MLLFGSYAESEFLSEHSVSEPLKSVKNLVSVSLIWDHIGEQISDHYSP